MRTFSFRRFGNSRNVETSVQVVEHFRGSPCMNRIPIIHLFASGRGLMLRIKPVHFDAPSMIFLTRAGSALSARRSSYAVALGSCFLMLRIG